MEVPNQTLPAVEPGQAIPKELKLPRIEGVGVQDKPGDPDYPKMVPHPIHGSVKVLSVEHEAVIAKEIATLPPPAPPTAEQRRDAEITKAIGRPMTDAEKAFVDELEAASRRSPIEPADPSPAGSAIAAQGQAPSEVPPVDPEKEMIL